MGRKKISDKPVMTITMPKEVRDKLSRIAKKERRSESSMIHYLIDKYEEK